MFSKKILIFLYKKSKKAVVWLFVVFRFSFSFFNVLLLSLAMKTAKIYLGDLHLFCDFLFRFQGEPSAVLEKNSTLNNSF